MLCYNKFRLDEMSKIKKDVLYFIYRDITLVLVKNGLFFYILLEIRGGL